jgi:hypothetical protein
MIMIRWSRRTGIVLVAILIATTSDPHAQVVGPAQRRITPDPVTNWGSTFHTLEQKAGRVTTRFADGSAVAERDANGQIHTWLYSTTGNEIATLTAHQSGPMRLDVLGTTKVNTMRRSGVIPTLSWANEQAYALFKAGGAVEWHGEVLRGKHEPLAMEIEVEFEGGFVGRTKRYTNYYLTFLHRDGRQVGWVRYHPKERQLVFQFPGIVQDVLTEASLKPIGGWTFTPTIGWMHVQALAFYQFYSAARAKQVAQAKPTWFMKPELNWFQKGWEKFFPTAQAQEGADGCTGLHYLDSSIFRPCCDRHDLCYIKNGCDRSSWYWPWGNSWICTGCNVVAVWCFLGAGHETDGYIWYPTP